MTKRERIIAALEHRETGCIPYHLECTTQEHERVARFLGDESFEENVSCLCGWQYWGFPEERTDKPEHFTDDFGVTWNRSGADKDIGVIDCPVIGEPEISLYPEPYLNEKRIREHCQRILDTRGDRFSFAGIGFSLFERLWSYLGMEDALVYMITEPEFVHDLLDCITDFNLRVLDILCEYPFDAIYFGDDWGQQKGMIMGAPLWREFLRPRLKRMYDRVKESGKFILQHSCGDIEEVFPDLMEIGLDCYQTVQPEIYDLASIKEKYGDRLSFWGGISTQREMRLCTPDELTDVIRETIRVMSRGGGYIAAPTHAIPQDVPPENVASMMAFFEKM